jgi:NADH dehydrogenase
MVTVGCTDVEAAKSLKTMGMPGQVAVVKADVLNKDAVSRALTGADHVVNLVGLLAPHGRHSFSKVHADAPGMIAAGAAAAGVRSLVQVSAIGADADSKSAYARTKAAGEENARKAFPDTVVLRPSVVFGPDDGFFNRFADLAAKAPAMPLIGGARTLFQPVYVDDVAAAVLAVLGQSKAAGKTYELGGPDVVSLRKVMTIVMEQTQRQRPFVPLPFWLARVQARFLELLPNPPLTRDQVTLLQSDNVVAEDALTLADLGIEATSFWSVLPTYLRRYRPGGMYNAARI